MRQIAISRSVGSLPLLPYTSMVANCLLWLLYGLAKQDIRIWGTNAFGLCCATLYCIVHMQYSPRLPPTVRNGYIMTLGGIAFVYLSPLDHATVFGNTAVLFSVLMFGSPLAALQTVLKTKSARSIPLPFTLATLLNCILWSIVGWMDMKDANIYLPNLLGLAFGIAQVVLKLMYKDGKRAGMEDKIDLIA